MNEPCEDTPRHGRLCGEKLRIYKAAIASRPRGAEVTARKVSLPMVDSPQCVYEGEITQPCPSCRSDAPTALGRHRRKCNHPTATHAEGMRPGVCTREYVSEELTVCDDCDFRVKPPVNPNAALPPIPETPWLSTAQLVDDARSLVAMLPPDVNGIVGIPRSGMLPASVVAAHSHLPLFALAGDGTVTSIGHGNSRPTGLDAMPSRVAVIDDTVWAGLAMARAKKILTGRAAVYGAVYVRPGQEGHVDFYGRAVITKYTEWNLFNSSQMTSTGLDFDGVICHDAESAGPIGQPLWLPRFTTVPLIATGRPESSRADTEGWLARWGVKFARLEMMPGDRLDTWEAIAEHKARHYRESDCRLFIESDIDQAARIHGLSGRPVICPIAGRVFGG